MAAADTALSAGTVGQVDSLNHEGWGVVRAGKTVFVAGALPGETIEYRIRRRQRSHDEAELLRVIEPSPQRVTPPCAHFGHCGGCALQHLAPAAQRDIKEQMLRETLRRVGKVEPARWLEPLHGVTAGYRRRARLGARFVHAKGRSLVGFRERLSSYVAAIDRCHVMRPEVGELIGELSALVTSLSIPTRIPQVEVAVGDNATVLVLRILSPLSAADRQRLVDFETRHGVRWLLQAGSPQRLEAVSEPPPELWYELPEFDVSLVFEPADFIQVNGAMNRLMVSRVVDLLELDPDSRVLDLFCGLGNFTLPLARRAAQVTGLEGEAGLVARAAQNAARNGIGNVTFHAANLAGEEASGHCLALARRLGGPYTHVLLDPPRTGALDVLPAVAELAPRRLVYVSCHPGSLARDLAILVTAHGFRLQAAGIVDMFPHTSHVESIAVLDGPEKNR